MRERIFLSTRYLAASLLVTFLSAAPVAAIELRIKNCTNGLVSVFLYNNYDSSFIAYASAEAQLPHKVSVSLFCATNSCRLRVSYAPDYRSPFGRVIDYIEPSYKTDLCLLNADQQVLHEIATCSC